MDMLLVQPENADLAYQAQGKGNRAPGTVTRNADSAAQAGQQRENEHEHPNEGCSRESGAD